MSRPTLPRLLCWQWPHWPSRPAAHRDGRQYDRQASNNQHLHPRPSQQYKDRLMTPAPSGFFPVQLVLGGQFLIAQHLDDQFLTRAEKHSLDEIADETARDILKCPHWPVLKRAFAIRLFQKALIDQDAHQVRDRDIRSIVPGWRDSHAGLRSPSIPHVPKHMHHLQFPLRQFLRHRPCHCFVSWFSKFGYPNNKGRENLRQCQCARFLIHEDSSNPKNKLRSPACLAQRLGRLLDISPSIPPSSMRRLEALMQEL